MKKRVRCTAAFAAAVMAVSLLGGCGQDGVTAPENVEKYTADGGHGSVFAWRLRPGWRDST